MSETQAVRAIWDRSYTKLIRARARIWKLNGGTIEDHAIPHFFWWPGGFDARKENWIAGDFEVRLRGGKVHCRAYGVEFLRVDIVAMLGGCDLSEHTQPPAAITGGRPVSLLTENTVANTPLAENLKANSGGRRPAKFWDDLWAEMSVVR